MRCAMKWTVLFLCVVSSTAFQIRSSSISSSKRGPTTTRLQASAFDTMLDFNKSFKSGLKFILVPQAKNSQVQPVINADIGSNPSVAVAVSNPSVNDAVSNPSVADAVTAQEAVATLETATKDAQEAVVATASSSLEQTAKDAHDVLDAAKEMFSGGTYAWAAYTDEDIVERTTMELQEKLSNVHPIDIQDFIPSRQGGGGLATPIVDFVMKTLYEIRDSPSIPQEYFRSIGIQEVPPEATVVFGFEVKTSLLEFLEATNVEAKSKSMQFVSWFVESAEKSYENSAPLRRDFVERAGSMQDGVRTTLLQTQDGMRTKLLQNYDDVSASLEQNMPVWRDAMMNNYETLGAKLTAFRERLGETDVNFALPMDQLSAMQSAVQRLLQTGGWNIDDLVQALNLKELGGVYAGTVAAIFLIAALSDRQTSVKPNGTAKRASASLKMATATASKATKDAKDADQERLAEIVMDLTRAVAILTNELKDLKSQKTQTDHDLATMKSDVRTVKNEVEQTMSAEHQLEAKLEEIKTQNDMLKSQLSTAKFEVETLAEVNDALTAGISAVNGLMKPHPPESPPPTKIRDSESESEELDLDEAFFVTTVDVNVPEQSLVGNVDKKGNPLPKKDLLQAVVDLGKGWM